MQLLLISNDPIPQTLWGKPFPFEACHVIVATEPNEELLQSANLCIDLSFEEKPHRIDLYKSSGIPVMINSCVFTLQQMQIIHQPVLRFNHWPTFNQRVKPEIAVNEGSLPVFESIFNKWEIEFEKTSDIPGFVSSRIVVMIINEAFLALEEQVSTMNEIDTAMKLGTNYPKGPFEWCDVIGAKNVFSLLETMAFHEIRYMPATLLKQKAHEQ
jgi:3-hydroxybutyryl-CoA dehydrogenase